MRPAPNDGKGKGNIVPVQRLGTVLEAVLDGGERLDLGATTIVVHARAAE